MPSSRPRAASSAMLAARVLATAAVIAAATACSRLPVAPDAGRSPLLGEWRGTITSDVIGTGLATLVLSTQAGLSDSPLFTGTWRFEFADPAFGTSGAVSANLDMSKTTLFVFFNRAVVPCPAEPGGTAERSMVADLRIESGVGLRGPYLAGGCPVGTISLARR